MTTIILGREGMGEATEEDFDNWVSYVCAHIDERCGFEVEVETRLRKDIQTTDVVRCSDNDKVVISDVLIDLWDEWCRAGAK